MYYEKLLTWARPIAILDKIRPCHPHVERSTGVNKVNILVKPTPFIKTTLGPFDSANNAPGIRVNTYPQKNDDKIRPCFCSVHSYWYVWKIWK